MMDHDLESSAFLGTDCLLSSVGSNMNPAQENSSPYQPWVHYRDFMNAKAEVVLAQSMHACPYMSRHVSCRQASSLFLKHLQGDGIRLPGYEPENCESSGDLPTLVTL